MNRVTRFIAEEWIALGPKFLPFADAATTELPIGRLLRLALFQISVGMVIVLLNGTINRVMVVELDVPVWLVSLMVSLPLLFAPFRALIGHRSDYHKSFLGWRRVPYIWMGTLLQFGGLAIMPFALLVLADKTDLPYGFSYFGAAIAFLLVGIGMHTTQTAGLALATDIAPESKRPRVVALLYVMLLLGMVGSSILFSFLLENFSALRLIQVIQGAAIATIVFNCFALWQQESRDPKVTSPTLVRPTFSQSWQQFSQSSRAMRLLIVVGLGTAGFSMQDILLEPYGGEILAMSVSSTTLLTAILTTGTLFALLFASYKLNHNADPARLAGLGSVVGVFAFAAVLFAAPLELLVLFYIGTALIGFGGGLFAVGTLIYAMSMTGQQNQSKQTIQSGIALGAWGAVQATAAGIGIALGGAIRDISSQLAMNGLFGEVMNSPVTGYGVVYVIEILLLFATLAAIGPLVKSSNFTQSSQSSSFGLAGFPS